MDFIPEDEIDNETSKLQNTDPISPVVVMYPYKSMDHRQFEILCYRLLKAELTDFFEDSDIKVKLMKGVQDEGQDIAFVKSNSIFGVVQCKRYASKVKYDQVIRELLKVIMYLIKEDNYCDFKKYIFISPDGCNTEANKFISNFKDPNYESDIKEAVEYNRKTFKASLGIPELEYANIKDNIESVLADLEIQSITSIELDSYIIRHPEIAKLHFQVNSIIDIDSFKSIIDEYKGKISSSLASVQRVQIGFIPAKNGKRILDENDDYYNDDLQKLNEYGSELSALSADAKTLFAVCISTSHESSRKLRFDIKTAFRKIGLIDIYDSDSPDWHQAKSLLTELRDIYVESEDDEDGFDFTIIDNEFEWIKRIKKYCGNNSSLLDKIIVDLNFSLLDTE